MPISPEAVRVLEAVFIFSPGPQNDAFFSALAVVSTQDLADIRLWWSARMIVSPAPKPASSVSTSKPSCSRVAPRPTSTPDHSTAEDSISESEIYDVYWVASNSRPGVLKAKRTKPTPKKGSSSKK